MNSPNRPHLVLLIFLALGAATAVHAGVSVNRALPDSILTSDAAFDVTLSVTVTGDAPTGLVLTEELPAGCSVTAATWEGADFAPTTVGGNPKWLFGGPDGTAPASGALVYTVDPAGPAVGSYTFAGSAKYFDDAVEQEPVTTGDTGIDVLAPTTVAAVVVIDGLSIRLTFSADVGDSALVVANYALDGNGQGTLTAAPDAVARTSGSVYVLTWDAGEMLAGGDITVTVSNVLDSAGHPIGSPDNGTDSGGAVGTTPTVTARTPTPGSYVTTTDVDLEITFSEQVAGVEAADLVLSGNAGGSVGTPTNPSDNTWRFTITGLAGGTLNLSLAADPDDVEDLAGNDLAPETWSYTIVLPVAHPYDADQDWDISADELNAMNADWAAGATNPPAGADADFYYLWTVELWQAGGYEHDYTRTGYQIWQPVAP